jgi:hypothetical protein
MEKNFELLKEVLYKASDLIEIYPDGTTSKINREGLFGFDKWIEQNL